MNINSNTPSTGNVNPTVNNGSNHNSNNNNKRTFTQYNLQPTSSSSVTYTFNVPTDDTALPTTPLDAKSAVQLRTEVCNDIDAIALKLKKFVRHITTDTSSDRLDIIQSQFHQYTQQLHHTLKSYCQQLSESTAVQGQTIPGTDTSTKNTLKAKRGPSLGSKRGFACLACFLAKAQCTGDTRPCIRCQRKSIPCQERYKKSDGSNYDRKELIKLYYSNSTGKTPDEIHNEISNDTGNIVYNSNSNDNTPNIASQYVHAQQSQPQQQQQYTLLPQQHQHTQYTLQQQPPPALPPLTNNSANNMVR